MLYFTLLQDTTILLNQRNGTRRGKRLSKKPGWIPEEIFEKISVNHPVR